MLKLDKPTFLPSEVLISCISNYTDEDLKNRLESCKDEIDSISETFESRAIATTLHTLRPHEGVRGVVTTQEMKKVYTDKMAKINQPGRTYYNEILALPKFGRCPLCGQRKVSTLDHHLPKSKYPALAVTPSNLIPSCIDCNKLKTSGVPQRQEDETIHPYFDDVESERWLFARVLESEPPTLQFFVTPNPNWDDIKNTRVKNHFDNFNLAALYSSYAGEELISRAYTWFNLYSSVAKNNGPDNAAKAVREDLLDDAYSYQRVRLNSWQAATYEALADSQWFCSEGLKLIL